MAVAGDHSNASAHPSAGRAAETDYSPPRGNPFPVVGIGASAGGLEAFTDLLRHLPEKTGLAFVLVQHLDPQHESMLVEILAPASKMPVETVRDGVAIEPDHIYVIPPNTSMELRDGHLGLVARAPGLHLPIDIFFESLARVQGSRGIGVVLSGNASDGSIGVRAIKAECGITFAQDESTAKFGGMPRSAIATGAIDYVLSPAQIGRELGRIGHHPFMVTPEPGVAHAETLPEGDGDFKRILGILQAGTKVDFSQYKPTTIQRRIGRRLMVLRIDSLASYASYLAHKPAEVNELYRDLLISVTSFFRDPATFESLMKHLKTALDDRGNIDDGIRVWAPGCATGEEVYSLAICLHEFLQQHQLSMPIQLFGTDISEPALERARHGLYGSMIADDVSEQRLRRYFSKTDGSYQINKAIRECCVFARHDVTRDPPFSHLDVVSCRNVLIYFDSKLQRRVLPTFHYALKPTGLLIVGSAETTAAASDLFAPVDKACHVYSRRSAATRMILAEMTGGAAAEPLRFQAEAPVQSDLHKKLERVIQTKYSPDAVVVNQEMQILQFRGHTAPYLDPTPGEATLNLLRMARESLVMPLRRLLQRARESDMLVRETGLLVENQGAPEEISIEATPVIGAGPWDRCFLVVFIRDRNQVMAPVPAEENAPASGLHGEGRADVLQRELADTREYLRSLTEQYEAHAEEFRAANEEARSANEELQSTNEELGTTREELQSSNEELTTVNEELQNRNQELSGTNADLRNLLAAVTVAIVMVDQDLRVRRFNSAAEKLMNLGAVDIGRPVGHLRGRIETPRLEGQVRKVIDLLTPAAEEVQDVEGRWYSIAVRPYRTLDDRIAGAVITFQDIDPLKRGLEASEEAREYAEALIETVREPLVVLDADLRVLRATAAFYQTFLVSRDETERRPLYDLGNGQWNKPRLRELVGTALFKSEPFHDFEIEHDFPHIGRRTMRLNARRIPRRDPQQRTVLLAIEDVTERREIAEIRYQRLFEAAKDGIVVIDDETGTVLDVNAYFLQLTGFAREDFIGKNITVAGALLGIANAGAIIPAARSAELVRYEDRQVRTRQGPDVSVEVVGNRYMVGTHPIIQLNIRDITSRKESARALAESEERFRLVVDSVRDYAIFQMDGEGRVVTWNNGAERLLGWRESEIVGGSSFVIFTPEDVAAGQAEGEIQKALHEGRAADERWHVRKDGSRFFASGVLTRAQEGAGGLLTKVMQDITTRKEQEDRLRRSVEEKSMLVREIHHRVKNNLQMIVSLLNLQSRQSRDPQVLTAFEETQGRVRAIAHIHEQLYASEDLSEVEVGAYVTALARELVALHATLPEGVTLETHAETMVLHVEKAIPLALIANELILNSLKHGLASGTGRLKVTLAQRIEKEGAAGSGRWAELCVDDDGPGLPPGFDAEHAKSMGFRLMNLLIRQIKGRLDTGAPGGRFMVSFPLEPK
ncbi:MAG: chemotaxis protein CheB [Terriglobia bacterium]